MSILNGKKVLLGISGGIAAYKSANLVRLFIKSGAEVQVIMTPSSKSFITPLTLSTLSKNEVYSEFFDEEKENKMWNNHVEMAMWADYFIIAPATSNTISKMASARANNLLIATYLSAKCPVFFAPAMDLDMHKNKGNQTNIKKLIKHGNIHIPASSGFLASGLEGEGRMKEPNEIVDFISNHILRKKKLFGKKVLITAGPTFEYIDPVRYIGNFSSGKMGFALANIAAELGAEVYLVTGPSALTIKSDQIKKIDIISADEMFKISSDLFKKCDIAILSAAVSDFKPKKINRKKIKKENFKNLSIELVPNIDILKTLGSQKTNQILVGFALETDNGLENAYKKIDQKNLDAIVLNNFHDKGAGFNSDTNKITFINNKKEFKEFKLKSKEKVSLDIFKQILKIIDE